jgi:hypothetical protein
MQKSRSEPNCQSNSASAFRATLHSAYPKRKSTGNLNQSISQASISRSNQNKVNKRKKRQKEKERRRRKRREKKTSYFS